MSKLRLNRLTLLLLALLTLSATRAWGQATPGQQGAGQAEQTGKTWAIVVGISKYPRLPGGQQLQFADSDAALFAEALKRSGIAAENVRLLAGADATAQQIKSLIGNWLARSASQADTVYLFFSGHGMVEREFGESYLLASDSDAKEPYATAISLSELTHALANRVRAGRVYVIVDAVRRDLFPETETGAASAFVQAFDRLASSRAGLSALLASGPGEFSREGRAWGGHGVFTKQLLDGLSGSADSNRDGAITADEVFNFLSARVPQETSNKQHPWQSQSRLSELVISRTEPKQETIAKADSSQAINRQVDREPVRQPVKQRDPVKQEGKEEKSSATTLKAKDKQSDKQPGAIKKPEAKKSDEIAQLQNRRTEPSKPDLKESESKKIEATKEPESTRPQPSKPKPIKENQVKSGAVKKPARSTPSPPEPGRISSTQPAGQPSGVEGGRIASENLPLPPRPAVVPPGMVAVTGQPNINQPVPPSPSMAAKQPEAGPSPIVLQLEAAISSGNLFGTSGGSAWELYQKLAQEQALAADAARLKPMLADALMKSSRSILTGDVRADNVSDKVEDFRRAGQMLARARQLAPAGAEATALERLSAAQALIALQFYDEAERSLAQFGASRTAAVENAMGLIFQGKLDEFQAERAYRRAIEIDPNWAAPHYNLALIYRSRKSPDSLQYLESAARLDSTNAAILSALGDEYFSKELWQQAAEAYKKAVAIKPSDAALHTKLGHALYSQGLRDEANREYQKAAELRGKQP